jgi:hypothetical protein
MGRDQGGRMRGRICRGGLKSEWGRVAVGIVVVVCVASCWRATGVCPGGVEVEGRGEAGEARAGVKPPRPRRHGEIDFGYRTCFVAVFHSSQHTTHAILQHADTTIQYSMLHASLHATVVEYYYLTTSLSPTTTASPLPHNGLRSAPRPLAEP